MPVSYKKLIREMPAFFIIMRMELFRCESKRIKKLDIYNQHMIAFCQRVRPNEYIFRRF